MAEFIHPGLGAVGHLHCLVAFACPICKIFLACVELLLERPDLSERTLAVRFRDLFGQVLVQRFVLELFPLVPVQHDYQFGNLLFAECQMDLCHLEIVLGIYGAGDLLLSENVSGP
jgi:hypothetical protein